MPTTEQDETQWWVRVDELSALIRYLSDTGRLDHADIDALCRVIEKPWNWSRERAEMLALRTPKRLSVVGR